MAAPPKPNYWLPSKDGARTLQRRGAQHGLRYELLESSSAANWLRCRTTGVQSVSRFDRIWRPGRSDLRRPSGRPAPGQLVPTERWLPAWLPLLTGPDLSCPCARAGWRRTLTGRPVFHFLEASGAAGQLTRRGKGTGPHRPANASVSQTPPLMQRPATRMPRPPAQAPSTSASPSCDAWLGPRAPPLLYKAAARRHRRRRPPHSPSIPPSLRPPPVCSSPGTGGNTPGV